VRPYRRNHRNGVDLCRAHNLEGIGGDVNRRMRPLRPLPRARVKIRNGDDLGPFKCRKVPYDVRPPVAVPDHAKVHFCFTNLSGLSTRSICLHSRSEEWQAVFPSHRDKKSGATELNKRPPLESQPAVCAEGSRYPVPATILSRSANPAAPCRRISPGSVRSPATVR
jgi:hypothetical protein